MVPEEAVAEAVGYFKWTCGECERGSQLSEILLIRK